MVAIFEVRMKRNEYHNLFGGPSIDYY